MTSRLLVLGGSRFVGRAVVDAALARGWDVTTANLGESPRPMIRQVVLDRTSPGALRPLLSGRWNAIVDTWAGDPSAVREAVDALGDRAAHWTYVSTMAAYRGAFGAPITESTPTASSGALRGYAARKRRAEEILEATAGVPLHVVRPGVVLGPHEYAGRLAWWLRRLAAGGRVLAPAPRSRQLQFVDARDLATWILLAAEDAVRGTTNVTSPPGRLTAASFLATCAHVAGDATELVWVDPRWLRAAGVAPWTTVPLWVDEGTAPDVYDVDVARATLLGATFRDPAATVRDTWEWLRDGGESELDDRPWLDAAVEARLLRLWSSRGEQQAPDLVP